MIEELLIPVPGDRKEVELLAYKLWELSGRTHGNDVIHWVLAELLLTQYTRIPSRPLNRNRWTKGTVWSELKAMTAD